MLVYLHQEYEYGKTVEDEPAKDLDLGHCRVNNCPSFRYVVITRSSNGKISVDFWNIVEQKFKMIRWFNSPLWSSRRNKEIIVAINRYISLKKVESKQKKLLTMQMGH